MRYFFCYFILACALSGCYTASVLSSKRFDDSRTQILVRNTIDECTIEITGEITSNTISLFNKAVFEVNSRICKEKWVILSSDGGTVIHAMEIGQIIKNKGYNTQIHHGNSCASACGMIFISGKNRAISSSVFPTRIGFHQMSKSSYSDKTCIVDANNEISQILKSYSRKMLPEKSANFFYNRVMETDCNKISYISSDEALSEGISNSSIRICNNCALIK